MRAEEDIQIQEKLINFLSPSASSDLKGVQREATLYGALLLTTTIGIPPTLKTRRR